MSHNTKVLIIITDSLGNALLIKEKYKKNPKPLWNAIKGTYGDMGQETIFETAIRECWEEAGVKVQLTNSLRVFVSQEQKNVSVIFSFVAEITEGTPKLASLSEQKQRDEYISEIRWFTKKDILNMNKDDFISSKVYTIIKSWMNGELHPLDIVKQLK